MPILSHNPEDIDPGDLVVLLYLDDTRVTTSGIVTKVDTQVGNPDVSGKIYLAAPYDHARPYYIGNGEWAILSCIKMENDQ